MKCIYMYIAALQWLEYLWNCENMFETGIVRANGCSVHRGQTADEIKQIVNARICKCSIHVVSVCVSANLVPFIYEALNSSQHA